MKRISPCVTCTRVKDPAACENKDCRVWRQWYIERWEQLRQDFGMAMQKPAEPVGVVIGGQHYAAPDQARTYLQEDPCKQCACPKALCTTACPLKRGWLRARQVVGN